MEGLRTPWSQDEMEGTFSTEYTRLDLHHHQIIDELDELLASLNVSVVLLFHTINKPKKRLVNLKEYKQKRLAISEYKNAIETLGLVKELKSQAMDKWIKFLKDNEDNVYVPRQGRFNF
jgi:predicted S18 family serine protease